MSLKYYLIFCFETGAITKVVNTKIKEIESSSSDTESSDCDGEPEVKKMRTKCLKVGKLEESMNT